MLYDLSWIAKGKPWPPEDKDERDRRAEHVFNRQIYNNQHEVLSKFAKYTQDQADDDKKSIIILGWGEKATTNYINLCIGEEPDVEVRGQDLQEERPDEEVLIDVSRYGHGLYEVTEDGILAQNPERCYMVVTPGNIRKIQYYVFFDEFTSGDKKFIKFTIHGRGFIQHLIHELEDTRLGERQDLAAFPAFAGLKFAGEEARATGQQATGVDDILVVRVDNALSSERWYGRSDYTPSVVSLIEALDLAFSRREEVLAKFTRPGLQAPDSAFNHYNFAKGAWEIHLDEPIRLEPGSLEAKYLTWDAQLASVEKAIQEKMDQLLQMLDLVKQEELGKAESGTALAFRLIPTTARVKRFATGLKRAIPKVESLRSKLPGFAGSVVEPEDVSVTFQSSLPRDPLQTAQWATMALGAGGMSLKTYISITQGLEMSDDPESAIMQELARIEGDEEARQALAPAEPAINLPPAGTEQHGLEAEE